MAEQSDSGIAQKQPARLATTSSLSASTSHRSLEEQRRRLGDVDKLQMRLIAQADSVRRYQMMYPLRDYVIQTWKRGLQTKYPELSDMDRCRLLFEKLQSNG